MIPVIEYEYVPPGGVAANPVRINGFKKYSPGDHDPRVDFYSVRLPDSLQPDKREGWRFETFDDVVASITHWFGHLGETEASVRAKIDLTYRDEIQFPVSMYGILEKNIRS